MDEEIRKARSRQYGSFLYCPDRDCLCFGRETDLECKHESCILDDPEYQALQKRIEENRKRNELKALRENPNTSRGSVGKNSMRENAIGRVIRSEETILYMKSFGFGQNYEN